MIDPWIYVRIHFQAFIINHTLHMPQCLAVMISTRWLVVAVWLCGYRTNFMDTHIYIYICIYIYIYIYILLKYLKTVSSAKL